MRCNICSGRRGWTSCNRQVSLSVLFDNNDPVHHSEVAQSNSGPMLIAIIALSGSISHALRLPQSHLSK